ncbi:MAG TPA: protoporphyrinogen oxidase, partial [Corynebacterium sp.]|nr:protoporphyrinogen oxidase [Corynebacterium sp.]
EEDLLVDAALDDLRTITGFDGRAAGLSEIYVQRWFGGLPRYDETHLATVATVREAVAEVPGLEVTGAWAGGVGVPAVIDDARAAVARVIQVG